jgi:hypothetical protein
MATKNRKTLNSAAALKKHSYTTASLFGAKPFGNVLKIAAAVAISIAAAATQMKGKIAVIQIAAAL